MYVSFLLPALLSSYVAFALEASSESLSESVHAALMQSLLAEPGLVNGTNSTSSGEWDQMPQWAAYTFAAVILVVGLIIVSAGYRFLRLSAFIIGGFIPAVLVFGLLGGTIPDDNASKTQIVYWTALCVWIAAGTFFACCIQFVVFALGFALGTIIALALNPVALQYVWPDQVFLNLFLWILLLGFVSLVAFSFPF